MMPSGRGVYIWHLSACEGGDLGAIVARCQRASVSWLAVKAADHGESWQQFSPALVQQLRAADIGCFGWGYDVPGHAAAQAACIARVAELGADGYIIDAESEWERSAAPNDAAHEYVDAIWATGLPATFTLMDAPWDVIRNHGRFPFSVFAEVISARCPQAYWTAHCLSERESTARAIRSWDRYHARHLEMTRPLIWSGCVSHARTVAQLLEFELRAFEAQPGPRLYWCWDNADQVAWRVWEGA